MMLNLHGYGKMNYDELLKIEYGALDLLPIKDFLKKDAEVQEIRHAIEDAIELEPHELNPKFWKYMEEHEDLFHDDIFNWMDEYEFIKYCETRFPDIKWHSEYIERHWIV